MTTSTEKNRPAPIQKTFDVKAPREIAFRVFTAEMTSWWQLESHHVGKARAVAAVVEPRVGGRWFERGEDGSECDWGKVLAWEPPGRLVLAWQLDATFTYDPQLHTEVEVRFVDAGGGVTRVEFEHRKLEAYAERADELRGVLDSPGGWGRIVEDYAKAAETAARS